MEEICVVEVNVIAVSTDERWLGESFWLLPSNHEGYTVMMELVAKEMCLSSLGWRDYSKKWLINVEFRTHRLRGPLAKRMERHLDAVSRGDKPSFDWQPVLPPPQSGFFGEN